MIKGINGDTFVSTENRNRRFDLGSTFYTLLSGNDRQQPRWVRWVNRIHSNWRYPCCCSKNITQYYFKKLWRGSNVGFTVLLKPCALRIWDESNINPNYIWCSIWSCEEVWKYGLAQSEISALPQLANGDLLDRLPESCRQHGMFPLLPLHTCHRSQGYGGNIWKYSHFTGWHIFRLVLHR